MRERLQAKVDRLERENDALRDELAIAARRLADHESGDALAAMRQQRDVLMLFARQCEQWASSCQCGFQATRALEAAGLTDDQCDRAISACAPELALRLLRRP